MATILEIRENALCIIVARKSGKKILVKDTFKLHSETPFVDKGLFVMTEKNINDFKKLLKKYHIIDRKFDVVVNYRTGITRDLYVPKLDKRKMKLVIENEMSNIYNLNKDYIIDYRMLKSNEVRADKKIHVLATALSYDFIRSLEMGLNNCKLKIKSLDLAQSSFLKFVESFDFVESVYPTIVVELGNTYIRSYLFDVKELKIMRTIYFFEEEPFSAIMNRLFQVVDLMDQSYSGETSRGVKNIVVLGSDLYVPRILSHYKTQDDIKVTIVDCKNFAKGRKHASTEYLSSLGVLA